MILSNCAYMCHEMYFLEWLRDAFAKPAKLWQDQGSLSHLPTDSLPKLRSGEFTLVPSFLIDTIAMDD